MTSESFGQLRLERLMLGLASFVKHCVSGFGKLLLSQRMNDFVYCGARYGEIIDKLHPRYHFDCEWRFHFFDPNPHIPSDHALRRASVFGAECVFHRRAVWTEDCAMEFQLQNSKNRDGQGSTVAALHSGNRKLQGGDCVLVEAIDFSRFINELQSSCIVVRMDIEGSEFPVLRKMIQEKTLAKIRDLQIEWHHRHLRSESRESVELLRRAIREEGVNLFDLA